MKSPDDLFQLIKSMTKSEKRYFKLFAQQQNPEGEFNYLKLFNAIDEQDTYDKDVLAASLHEVTNIKHLASDKNYLYHLIIKSLKNYYLSSSKEAEVDDLINCARVLYKKGLYEQSNKILSKSLALSEKYELYSSILKIAKLQIDLVVHMSSTSEELQSGFAKAKARAKDALSKLNNLNEYHELYTSFLELIRVEGEVLEKDSDNPALNSIVFSSYIKDEEKALSAEAKRLFYFINGAYHHITGDLPTAYQYELKGMEQIETRFDLFQQDYAMYSAQLANLCETCLWRKEYPLFTTYLQKLKDVPARYPMEESRVFYRYYDLLVRSLVQRGEYKQVIDLVGIIDNGFRQYEYNIHKSREISIKYYLAYACFGGGDLKKAMNWINKLLIDKTDFRSDFISFARILSCIIYFEQGDYLSTESVFRATHYFSKKNKRKSKTESLFLNFFRKVYKLDDPVKRRPVFIQYKKEMELLIENPVEKSLLEYFDLLSWIESKISGKSFAEIVRDKVK